MNRTIGDTIREAREKRNWCRTDLVYYGRIRLAPTRLSDVENNKILPSMFILWGVSRALNMDPYDLFSIWECSYREKNKHRDNIWFDRVIGRNYKKLLALIEAGEVSHPSWRKSA